MRIGYFVPEFPAQTHAFFWREASAIESLGHDIVWLSTRQPPPDACLHDFAEEARGKTAYVFPPKPRQCAGLALTNLPTAFNYISELSNPSARATAKRFGWYLCAAQLLKYCRDRQVEHLHVHSCANSAHIAAMCYRAGGPSYSLTLHGDLRVYGTDHAMKMQDAKFVSVVTRALQNQVIEKLGLPKERLPVIRMGVNATRFDADGRNYDSDKLTLTTVARLNRTKGHVHAIRAVKAALDQGARVEYLIAGDGPEKAKIATEIAQLGLSKDVRLLGGMAEDEVLQLLRNSDAFVLPSFGAGEAAPVSVMEAMACRLPVICSIIGGTPEMIRNGETGILVEQQDEKALADSIVSLANSPSERERLGTAAREHALAFFDYRANAQLLLEQIMK